MEDANAYVLCRSGRLKPYRAEVENVLTNAVELVSERIPLSHIDVVVHDCPFATREGMSIGGWAEPMPNGFILIPRSLISAR
jgi:hypothetical protein